MKKLIVLAITALTIAAVIFFGVKLIKATPEAEDEQKLDASVTTSVSPTATPAPVTTVTPTATPTTTPVPATEEAASESTSSEATASEATPTDPAEAYIESLREAGIHAEEIPAMARDEEKGYLKIVKIDDPALTKYSAMDLPLGENPQWSMPTRSGKLIVDGCAYMTRCVATVEDTVPDWYCTKHCAVKSSCDTTSEDYTLYKGVTPAEALKATRLVSAEDGGCVWREVHCECGATEKITTPTGGGSPTKKPTTPPTTPTPPPTKPDHPPYEGVDDSTEGGDNADHPPYEGVDDSTEGDADHGPTEGSTGDSSEQENTTGGAESDANESHGSLEGVGGGDEEPKAKRSSKKSFFND